MAKKDAKEWWIEKATGRRAELIETFEGETTYRFEDEVDQSRAGELQFRDRFSPEPEE